MDTLYKIECCDETATKIVSNLIDEHCVIEGTAILTESQMNDFTAQLACDYAVTGEVNEFDLAMWEKFS